MEREELSAWLRLTLTPGVGSQTGRSLLAAFGLPQAIFCQSETALAQVASRAQARALLTEAPGHALQLEQTWDWLHQHENPGAQRALTVLGDPLYPQALLASEDPPLLLYLMGQLSARNGMGPDPFGHCIAVVGSRNPTPQGQENARRFGHALVDAGLTVVSGMALGIDGAAHEGALDAAGNERSRWATVAVLGTGLDRVYPSRHLELARRIAQHGLLVSEYPLGTPPLPSNFPKRNRIIAGLCMGTLVVEAALQSGSLITARMAAEQGKEVFAIPGSIHSPLSRGCHALIRQGAKLVEHAQDILEELKIAMAADDDPWTSAAHTRYSGSESANALLRALGHDPVGLDALSARTGLDTASMQVQLLELELAGEVSRLPGGLFQRLGRA